jgi:hypothetical protein
MKTMTLTLIALLSLQSFAWARAGEADSCQRETVNAAMRLALVDYQNIYVVAQTLVDRQRDNDLSQDTVTLQLTSITGRKKTVKYVIGVSNEITCETQQLGGWFKAR